MSCWGFTARLAHRRVQHVGAPSWKPTGTQFKVIFSFSQCKSTWIIYAANCPSFDGVFEVTYCMIWEQIKVVQRRMSSCGDSQLIARRCLQLAHKAEHEEQGELFRSMEDYKGVGEPSYKHNLNCLNCFVFNCFQTFWYDVCGEFSDLFGALSCPASKNLNTLCQHSGYSSPNPLWKRWCLSNFKLLLE